MPQQEQTSAQTSFVDRSANRSENDPILPLKLYGAEFSYFTGKLEGVLRYLELPHQRFAASPTGSQARATGVAQIPALQLADGRWLTDTTPIIDKERFTSSATVSRRKPGTISNRPITTHSLS